MRKGQKLFKDFVNQYAIHDMNCMMMDYRQPEFCDCGFDNLVFKLNKIFEEETK